MAELLFRANFTGTSRRWIEGRVRAASAPRLEVAAGLLEAELASALVAGWDQPAAIEVEQVHDAPRSAKLLLARLVGVARALGGERTFGVRLVPAHGRLPVGIWPLLEARELAQAAELLRGWGAELPRVEQRRLALGMMHALDLRGDLEGYITAATVLLPEEALGAVLSMLYPSIWEAAEGNAELRGQLSGQRSVAEAFRALMLAALMLSRWEEAREALAEIGLES